MKAKRKPNLTPVSITMSHTEHKELREDLRKIVPYLMEQDDGYSLPWTPRGTVGALLRTLETV